MGSLKLHKLAKAFEYFSICVGIVIGLMIIDPFSDSDSGAGYSVLSPERDFSSGIPQTPRINGDSGQLQPEHFFEKRTYFDI